VSKFASIVRPELSCTEWHEERKVIAELAGAIDTEALMPALVEALRAAWEAGDQLPDVEELQERVPAFADAIANLPEIAAYGQDRPSSVARWIVNAGVARFLAQEPFDFKRLSAVSKLDRALDVRQLSDCFSRELAEPAVWVETLLGAGHSLTTGGSEDDQDTLQNEIAKWSAEREMDVPRWQQGNLVTIGLGDLLLLGALLRRVDEVGWLRFLDRQHVPAAISTLIWHAQLERDPVGLIRLIQLADAAFDEAGGRTESVAIFFLLEHALAVVEKDLERRVRYDLSPEQIEAEVAAQDDLLREIAGSVAQRPDGAALLVEVGADYLVRAQRDSNGPVAMQRRSMLHRRFADIATERLGVAEAVSGLARDRAARAKRRNRWGLWLLAANVTLMKKAPDRGDLQGLRQELWDRLISLAQSDDSGLHDRYVDFPEWVVHLVGQTLAKLSAPVETLEQAWKALTAQRLERVASRYEKDTWRLSKLFCRSGFIAARVAVQFDAGLAKELWSMAMAMAITSWLLSSSDKGFAEVQLGLSHLAAGNLAIDGQPTQTLAYLRGEPSLLALAAIGLKVSGMAVGDVTLACRAADIDAAAYLELASNKDEIAKFEEHLDEFRRARASVSP
jgi:hypothetical protein